MLFGYKKYAYKYKFWIRVGYFLFIYYVRIQIRERYVAL